MPIGTILVYAGDLDKLPSGWYLCDGTNGTPDLRGRFLEGVTTDAGNFIEAGLPNITGKMDDTKSNPLQQGLMDEAQNTICKREIQVIIYSLRQ